MQQGDPISLEQLIYIIVGTLVGFIGRWWLLRADYRQYPTYPNGMLIHLTTGFIAAAMGAVALPALISKNFVAVTFLALAIQQFRDIRKMERNSLKDLDRAEYFPRGDAYIDGIAKTFEARNYIVMISSLVTTSTALLIKTNYLDIILALLAGFFSIIFLKKYTQGQVIRDIAVIKEARIEFKEGNNLYVGDTYIMNVGLQATQERILKYGIGLKLIPKGENEKIILNHAGQRKAIMHECSRLLGLERYIETRRNFDTGEVVLVMVPIRKEIKSMIQIIEQVPILETNKKNEQKGLSFLS